MSRAAPNPVLTSNICATGSRTSPGTKPRPPTAIVPSDTIAEALLPLATERPPRVLGCWLCHGAVAAARARFRAAGIPDYPTPEEAVRAFSFLRQYHRHQAELMETPPALPEAVIAQTAAKYREVYNMITGRALPF